MKGRVAIALVVLGVAMVLAGCGGDESTSGATAASGNPHWSPPPDQLPYIGRKAPGPYVHPSDEPPPKELVIREVEEGTGPPAELGDTVAVHYVGVTFKGTAYSNSWETGEPDYIKLGSPDVELGFGRGVRGMKAGGRRELLVPPPLLFYPGEKPIRLGPGDSVAYLVDVVKIKKPDRDG